MDGMGWKNQRHGEIASSKERGMLRVIVQANAEAAKSYYGSGGRTSEYYAEGQEQAGEWGGLAARRLGLEGRIERDAFDALCENRHPGTGERITARTKVARRCGFDLNFHVPKSVSVVYGLTGDRSVVRAFQEAVRETLAELEAEARTRVRTGGRDETRTTGNLAYALFIHATSRPVDGIPDPHLHAHAFVHNLTFDEVEGRWKAVEIGEIYRNAPYYEAAFHARYACKLRELGFGISKTGTGWEIDGIPNRLLRIFSRRTMAIEEKAQELGIVDPELKGHLGAMTREGKQLRFTLEELRTIWKAKLTKEERTALDRVVLRQVTLEPADRDAARKAMAFAVEHAFERASVLPVKRLLAIALRHGVGQVGMEEVTSELEGHGLLVREYEGERLATTKEVLAEETRILAFAKKGRNAYRPLAAEDRPLADWLSGEQQAAIRHVLQSPDRIVLVRGVAGSGKTTLIRSCVDAIQDAGKPILLLAPSAEASRGILRKEGFADADTVARFLSDERFQESVRSGVLWIDEAGLLGMKSLDAVLQLANRLEARVILSGDDAQHHAVERGSPFTLLQRFAGLQPASVQEIRRQKGRYKEAVALLSQGQTIEGFDVIDRDLGWVKEVSDGDQPNAVASEYVECLEKDKSVLVVSPTHAEGAVITRTIRSALRGRGKLAAEEREYRRLEVRDLTAAERKEAGYYREGDVIEFHAQAKGFRTGARLTVTVVGRSSIAAQDEQGRDVIVPLVHSGKFQVYAWKAIPLAIGDKVRITKNGKGKDGRRLDNGMLSRVTAFSSDGGLILEGGIAVEAKYAHFSYGYVVTSHASQGKTVDRVLISQTSASFVAASREQFYVSASRARESLTVFTDDKSGLRRAIARSDPTLSATELTAEGPSPIHVWKAWVARRIRSIKRLIEQGATRTELAPTREHVVRART